MQSGGLKGPLLIMQGNGGVAHREHVSAIANLQSGPAGGMIASAYVAGSAEHKNVITTDMGGTSFDVGLITEGYWRYAQEPIVERFRMQQPIIDIESIGAGGGTIAQVEAETGRLLGRTAQRRRESRTGLLRRRRRAGHRNRLRSRPRHHRSRLFSRRTKESEQGQGASKHRREHRPTVEVKNS